METHSSILAWRIPWTEEADRLQAMGLQSGTRLRSCTQVSVSYSAGNRENKASLLLSGSPETFTHQFHLYSKLGNMAYIMLW